jgi:hypothetical protein
MSWFRSPSGQVFEAVGVWAKYALEDGCVEVPDPTAPPEPPPAPDTAGAVPAGVTPRTERTRR